MEEVWKDVLDYEGFYRVSNMGCVKSLHYGKERIVSQVTDRYGYLLVNLHKNSKRKLVTVHRLVYEAFNGKTDLQIDHIVEGNKLDNRLSNLQAITNRQNAIKHRLTIKKSSQYIGVSWNKTRKKWSSNITINRKSKHLGYFTDELEAANAYQNALKSL
jgi:hypothetical protein